MAKYSNADLLKEELSLIGSNDFLGRVLQKINKTSTVLLTIEVLKSFYLRAAVFCEDIQELSEMPFDQNHLVNLLYNDFLLYAKKNPDPQAMFGLLASLERGGREHQLAHQGNNFFKMVQQERYQEKIPVQLRLRRKAALRGEILLADMEEVQPEHGYTIEKILELLYTDFIDKFRKGDHTTALEAILKLLED